jgi:hypothetical protein
VKFSVRIATQFSTIPPPQWCKGSTPACDAGGCEFDPPLTDQIVECKSRLADVYSRCGVVQQQDSSLINCKCGCDSRLRYLAAPLPGVNHRGQLSKSPGWKARKRRVMRQPRPRTPIGRGVGSRGHSVQVRLLSGAPTLREWRRLIRETQRAAGTSVNCGTPTLVPVV